jgi:hypothetical protein
VLEEAVATLREELTRANARADSERDQADALRERIEDLQSRVTMASGLEAEQDRLRGEVEAAQIAQAEAEADTAELRDQLEQTRAGPRPRPLPPTLGQAQQATAMARRRGRVGTDHRHRGRQQSSGAEDRAGRRLAVRSPAVEELARSPRRLADLRKRKVGMSAP